MALGLIHIFGVWILRKWAGVAFGIGNTYRRVLRRLPAPGNVFDRFDGEELLVLDFCTNMICLRCTSRS
jgi:hypothetical protein